MAAPNQQPELADMADVDIDVLPSEDFIPGMHKVEDETSYLTPIQREEHEKIMNVLEREYDVQKDLEANKDVLRLREQFYHIHGTHGKERAMDAVVVLKAIQMLEQGIKVCILNLDFLRFILKLEFELEQFCRQRLRTRALYFFLKDHAMMATEVRQARRGMIFLKIQEEIPDDVDRERLVEELNELSEDWPLFVITDETCKEPERIDTAVNTYLTDGRQRFHFWSTSTFAHGTPEKSGRYRLDPDRVPPRSIKQLIEMIDIDDDSINVFRHHNPPIRCVNYPKPREGPEFNIRRHLDLLKTFLVSHDQTHIEADVWDCEQCGEQLASYLNEDIGFGNPGLKNNEVFIVGHLKRFESHVTVSGLEKSLLKNGIESAAPFCRRTVRIQDILEQMKSVVVADYISMRGVDKQIVIIIPNPRKQSMQKRVEQQAREADLAASIPDHGIQFLRPKSINEEDETVVYLRPLRSGDSTDGIRDYAQMKRSDGDTREDTDNEDLSEDEYDLNWHREPREKRRVLELLFSEASHQSVLRRAINSMGQEDKEMILDVLTDAPKHCILFHFAEDEHESDLYR